MTVTLAVYSTMIKDRVTGKLNSIYTAPVRRGIITGGYIAAAWTASVLVCMLTLFITEVCGIIKGLDPFPFITHVQLIGLIAETTFSGVPEEFLEEFMVETGIRLEVFDRTIGITEEWLGLLLCGILLLIVGIIVLKYGRKADR